MAVFDPVLNWLGRALMGVYDYLGTTAGKIVTLLLLPMVSFFVLINSLIVAVETHFNVMIALATDATGQATTLTLGTMFGIANYFVPLDLIFVYCALLTPLWLSSMLYRTIKSWIPTVS
jgi:hypothetical protein